MLTSADSNNQYCQSGTSPPEQPEVLGSNRQLKKCSKCSHLKPLDSFYKKGKRRDSSCKSCVRKKKKQSYGKKRRKKQVIQKTKHRVLEIADFSVEEVKIEASNAGDNVMKRFLEMVLWLEKK